MDKSLTNRVSITAILSLLLAAGLFAQSPAIPKAIVPPPSTVEFTVTGLPTNKVVYLSVTWATAKDVESDFATEVFGFATNGAIRLQWDATTDTNIVQAYAWSGNESYTYNKKQPVVPTVLYTVDEGHMQSATNISGPWKDQPNSRFYLQTNTPPGDKLFWRAVITRTNIYK